MVWAEIESTSGGGAAAVGEGGEEGNRLDRVEEKFPHIYRES
jgi:hypothetical protein